jgi:multidrug efflux system membrane fusion protein
MKNLYQHNQSVLYAIVIVLGLALWFASGLITSDQQANSKPIAQPQRSLLQKVRVRTPKPKRVSQEIILNGRLEPARAVILRAEVEGKVIQLNATKGNLVQSGEPIVRLDGRDRQARLNEARSLLHQRTLEFEGAGQLQRQQLQSEIQLAQAATLLESARARVAQIELEIRNTVIKAPFSGILDRLPVEVGAYLAPGDEVARLLDQDPIVFVGYASQQERHRLVLGDRGIAHLVTGLIAEGEVRYVAAEADPDTRTFKVEVHIPNPGGALVSGTTAEMRIPVRFVSALEVSPALLSLDSRDQLGIKVVNAQDVVEFVPVHMLRATAQGMWISGIADDVRIITVGQGFVRAGEKVVAIDEHSLSNASGGD